MRGGFGVLFVVAATCAGLVSAAQAASPGVAPWLPSESYAGGKRADSRLDQPVSFWGAGRPLADVFAELGKQTGVTLGFYPQGDENRDVPVHLFLNPEQPPSLRALMVQLAWVVDCSFAMSEAEGQQTYLLLSTSIAQSAESALHARQGRARAEVDPLAPARADKVDELREALALSREEAIERYRGRDDILLLTLLDPRRRAAAEFVCREGRVRPTEPYRPGVVYDGVGVALRGLRPESRAALQTAFGLPNEVFERPTADCSVGQSEGRVTLSLGPGLASGDGFPSDYTVVDISGAAEWRTEDEMALRRPLGEPVSAGAAAAYVQQRRALTSSTPAAAPQGPALSEAARERLSALTLPLAGGVDHPIWRLQEAVARASGSHVVSDAFVWWEAGWSASATAGASVSVLSALEQVGHAEVPDDRRGLRDPEWEWGDAGGFLRFRTANRDVWRAARLPASFLDWVDGFVAPCLPRGEEAQQDGFEVAFAVDVEAWARRIGALDDLQLRYGYVECYGEPADPRTRARRAVLDEMLLPIRRLPHLSHLLGRLSPGQWESLRTVGLTSPPDLSNGLHRLLLNGYTSDIMGAPETPGSSAPEPQATSSTTLLDGRPVTPGPPKEEAPAPWSARVQLRPPPRRVRRRPHLPIPAQRCSAAADRAGL